MLEIHQDDYHIILFVTFGELIAVYEKPTWPSDYSADADYDH